MNLLTLKVMLIADVALLQHKKFKFTNIARTRLFLVL